MPCNCDYMDPTDMEVEMSKVAYLLDELDGTPIPDGAFDRGMHPKVYNRGLIEQKQNVMVASLCTRLQHEDVSKYSLEMQMWWRDHQRADRERLEKELASKRWREDVDLALSKLTDYERELLGL